MIYLAPCVMFLMHADPLRGQVGGGWALEISILLGPEWHSPISSMPFHRITGPKKSPLGGQVGGVWALEIETFWAL